jgi:hypothetical protein
LATKEDLDRLIAEGDRAALLEAVRAGRKSGRLVRRITSRLCATDPVQKWQAVFAMGAVCSAGGLKTEQIEDRIKRFLWAMNDESGAVPFGVPEALGEVLAARPEFQPQCLPILVSFLVHEDLFQTGPILAGAIWALGRVGIPDEEERDRALPGFRAALKSEDPNLSGTALWSAARLRLVSSLREEIGALIESDRTVWLLSGDEICERRLADLAREALEEWRDGVVE